MLLFKAIQALTLGPSLPIKEQYSSQLEYVGKYKMGVRIQSQTAWPVPKRGDVNLGRCLIFDYRGYTRIDAYCQGTARLIPGPVPDPSRRLRHQKDPTDPPQARHNGSSRVPMTDKHSAVTQSPDGIARFMPLQSETGRPAVA